KPLLGQFAGLLQLLRMGRRQAAVVPGQFHRWHIAPRREVIVDDGSLRIGLGIALRRTGRYARRRAQIQHAGDGVETVASHVALRAAAEVVPAAPDERQVGAMERTLRRGTEPQVPVHAFGNRLRLLRTIQALGPERTAGPVMDTSYRPDSAAPDPLAEP